MTPLNKKVLVVDDDPDIRQILRDRLSFFGYAVETAMDGREAMDVLGRSRFDGMLLDVRMPGIDGIEVLRRTHENHPALPVVMISALSVPERAAQAIAQGACAYLIKPFDPVQLKQVTEQFFGSAA
jgi:CheY-like chemotaxis protein